MSEIQPTNLDKTYDPKSTEKWYGFWEEKGYFHAEIAEGKKPFTIMIPPPNVTGSLHMGHALNNTIQDALIRKHRMQGDVVLWLPGTDHAGIATQNVVEKQLHSEGSSRHELGREKFIERVWEWKEKYGNTIIGQLKKLGCSCDWERERFTMDEGYYHAVRKVFVELYNEGSIYRSNRIINWCPRCHTALSDIEVEHKDLEGSLWHIRYPFKDGPGYLIVATTRPETMLGDTAVAVNPNDKRYKNAIGKTIILPLVGREIPVVADDFVDPKFGTGAVKVTPAHDPNDFEIGQRHELPTVNIMTPEGNINENAPAYEGLDRFEARKAVVKDLESQGLIEKIESHTHAVGHCYRCHSIVEPYLSLQWFVDMKPLAGPAIDAVREGKVNFYPKRWSKLYFQWMENIKDWCISRQIWWGHQIPAWYCQEMQNEKCKAQSGIIVSLEKPDACPFCGSTNLVQDEDVLDTWFSSALWPFATLGWPEKTADLDYFYPTSVLVTARDILYFWVARMVMSGLKFMKDIPFHSVIINPTVLNWEGRRMSKSLGTGLDPLDYIEIYGTDALRFGMLYQTTEIQDMRFTEDKLEMSRNFANKIWNASRFVLTSFENSGISKEEVLAFDNSKLNNVDRWILSRFDNLIDEVSKNIDSYHFGEACQAFYSFFWNQYCDWYLELTKIDLDAGDTDQKKKTFAVLFYVLNNSMRLLHPFMPFISEEVWQRIPHEGDSICISDWPVTSGYANPGAVKEFDDFQDIVTDVRRIKSELQIQPGQEMPLKIKPLNEKTTRLATAFQSYIFKLCRLSGIEIGMQVEKPAASAVEVRGDYELYLEIGKVIDVRDTINKLEKRASQLVSTLEKANRKLENPEFTSKAPKEVIDKEKEKLESSRKEHDRLALLIESLTS